ncbi:acetyltransferase [Microscilla marina]|uniref:General glycosylation pathway protein n=1 Tax=Microscilla marina ATCC 23134 TaxID=313606 RepID=A1ZCI0_MICM2|nr:acetyltransferase [Microscilla marina]EAY31982.1 general glycosylation pathway protein [Microscilla marina ATCC 23134]
MNQAVVIGYSGHAYVVIDILTSMGYTVTGYYDREEKARNPYLLKYQGKETAPSIGKQLKKLAYFISIGDNYARKKVYELLVGSTAQPVNAIHPQSIVSHAAYIASQTGVMVAPNVVINACCYVGVGSICNTSSTLEHECHIGDFCHIAPGATLCGNVQVGDMSFIGANAVVKQGICIGKNVIIGAGAVVIKDVSDNTVVVGNPQRIMQ